MVPDTPSAETARTADVLVVGSGIAGCAAALAAAREGEEVLLVTKASEPEDAASDWAQGGIATTRGDPDSLKADIIDASAGVADPEAVDVLVENAADAVSDVLIETLGVEFDTLGAEYDFAQEAAHSEDRILHVDAATGQHVLRPFLSHLDAVDNVEILESTAALELLRHEGRVHGALLDTEPDGEPVFAGATILATGGIGDCFEQSTNPPGSTGDGIAMAFLAGAEVEDMEYVQFHPTAADVEEPFLLSEAVRGEGALLRNADGERFMPEYHPEAELAPRDVVARAVQDEIDATGGVTLDVSPLAEPFDEAFPNLAEKCADHEIDPDDGIPVAPCEHFLCGGVAVDDRGRASLDRLYAVGECARSGVHGANRLASTSLLEGLVWGLRAGRDATGFEPEAIEYQRLQNSDPALPDRFAGEKFHRLRRIVSGELGLRRTKSGIDSARGVLRRLKGEVDAYTRTRTSRSLYELRNATVVAILIANAAAENGESVGCHYLVDDAPAETESTAAATDGD
ncbi:L-aspartate oxidase [Halonotius roseus]|uniref:L-aspartate oxidase n=1 Tax=Halonotius roseus TaxID=2511997 RepID=A0A544QQU3_9EURY|nr:FAD-dependent oxidoreductase [Halonotius roseus]TQQ81817.1 FAD-dependent oxidoreductase [Halonotius roseus]